MLFIERVRDPPQKREREREVHKMHQAHVFVWAHKARPNWLLPQVPLYIRPDEPRVLLLPPLSTRLAPAAAAAVAAVAVTSNRTKVRAL